MSWYFIFTAVCLVTIMWLKSVVVWHSNQWRRRAWGLYDVAYWHRAISSNYWPTCWKCRNLGLLIRHERISGRAFYQFAIISELVVIIAFFVHILWKVGSFAAGKDISLFVFLCNRIIHYGAHQGLPLHTILKQLNAAYTFTPCFSSLSWRRLVFTFQLHSHLFKWQSTLSVGNLEAAKSNLRECTISGEFLPIRKNVNVD